MGAVPAAHNAIVVAATLVCGPASRDVRVGVVAPLVSTVLQLWRVPKLPHGLATEGRVMYLFKLMCSIVNCVVALLLINGLVASGNEADFELVTEPIAAFVWLLMTLVFILEHRRYVRRRE